MRKWAAEEAEAKWRAEFKRHAIILTDRNKRVPFFVAAAIAVDNLLRIDFQLDGDRESYIKKTVMPVSVVQPAKPMFDLSQLCRIRRWRALRCLQGQDWKYGKARGCLAACNSSA